MEENKVDYTESEKKVCQLTAENAQLKMQMNNAIKQLQESNMFNIFKRLDYLFKVLENKGSFNEQFVSNCTTEIVEMLTLSEEDKPNENQ